MGDGSVRGGVGIDFLLWATTITYRLFHPFRFDPVCWSPRFIAEVNAEYDVFSDLIPSTKQKSARMDPPEHKPAEVVGYNIMLKRSRQKETHPERLVSTFPRNRYELYTLALVLYSHLSLGYIVQPLLVIIPWTGTLIYYFILAYNQLNNLRIRNYTSTSYGEI